MKESEDGLSRSTPFVLPILHWDNRATVARDKLKNISLLRFITYAVVFRKNELSIFWELWNMDNWGRRGLRSN